MSEAKRTGPPKMNAERLQKLAEQVRIGGKGSVRRTKKIVHKSSGADEKKLQESLKRLQINPATGFEEVYFYKKDGTITKFTSPKVQHALNANTFVLTGTGQENATGPELGGQFDAETLQKLMAAMKQQGVGADQEGDEPPPLEENFEEVAKKAEPAKAAEPAKEAPKAAEPAKKEEAKPAEPAKKAETPKKEEKKAAEPAKEAPKAAEPAKEAPKESPKKADAPKESPKKGGKK